MKAGDAVRYRSLAHEFYDAVIAIVRADGTADLDVIAPGTLATVRLHAHRDGDVWTKEGL